MSRALLALSAVTLMELVSVAAFADQRDSYDRRGYLNICRVMVRQKICPTGTCPPGNLGLAMGADPSLHAPLRQRAGPQGGREIAL